jgi:uncharacterized protein YceK
VRRLLVLLLLGVLATGCGRSTKHASPTEGPSTTRAATTETGITDTGPATTETQPAQPIALRVYFLRGGMVAPVARTVPTTQAVAGAALRALVAGPTEAGLTSAIPTGTPAPSVTIDGGVATVDFPGGLSHAAIAQIVYTLTQFPSVKAVRPARSLDGKELTRADFEDVTPSILVESPLPGARVTSPLRVRGTANTFEATFVLEIRNASNRTFSRETVTATSGSGTRGTFDATISFTAKGAISLVAYEPSAENGKPLHTVRIPLVAG